MKRQLTYLKPGLCGFYRDSGYDYTFRVVCECDTDNFTEIFNNPNTFIEVIEFGKVIDPNLVGNYDFMSRVRKFTFESEKPLGKEG